MKTYVVYEIWTRSRLVQAESEEQALEEMPPHQSGLSLANWHAVEVPDPSPEKATA